MMHDERLREEWKRWLRTFYWTHFATGTWEQAISATAALGTVRRWLDEEKYPGIYAAVGVQKGPIRHTEHVHLLIGGVNPLMESLLRGSWIRSGHLRLDPYVAGGRAVSYIVDQATEIELIGDPLPFTPKRKRRQRSRG